MTSKKSNREIARDLEALELDDEPVVADTNSFLQKNGFSDTEIDRLMTYRTEGTSFFAGDGYRSYQLIERLKALNADKTALFESLDRAVLNGEFDEEAFYFDAPEMEEVSKQYDKEIYLMQAKVKSMKESQPCKRCGSIETIRTFKQTRSADEPMTEVVTCLACGKQQK